jgi:hypothetical protein
VAKKKGAGGATLADQLRAVVRASGPVSTTARKSGVPQPVLHRFVAGERDLTLRSAEKLLDYFGLEVRPRQFGRWEAELPAMLRDLIREAKKDRVEISLSTLCHLASKIEKAISRWDGDGPLTVKDG